MKSGNAPSASTIMRRARRSAGLCIDCAAPSETTRCPACNKKARPANARRAKNNPRDYGAYADRYREWRKKYIANKLELGICRDCPKLAVKGLRRCEECEAKTDAGRKAYINRQRSLGRCPNCGREKSKSYAHCAVCMEKARTFYRFSGKARTRLVKPRHSNKGVRVESYKPPSTPRRSKPIWAIGQPDSANDA